MNKKKQLFCLLKAFALTIALSCAEKKENDILVLDTQISPLEVIPLSRIFNNSGMVVLETNDSCMLGTILQVLKSGDDIYIIDFRMSGGFFGNRISKFDKTGRFIRWIGNQGNGPGEYHQVAAITADTVNQKLIAISEKNVLVYNSDGSFDYSYPSGLNSPIDNIYFHDDTLWVFNHEIKGKEERKILFFYHNSTRIDSLVLRKYNSRVNVLFVSNNSPILSDLKSGTFNYDPVRAPEPFLRDTLYEIRGRKLIPSIKLDFSSVLKVNNYVVPEDVSNQELFNECNKVRNITLKDIYRTENCLFADYSLDTIEYKYYYDLVNHKGFRSENGFKDDLFDTNQLCNPKPLNMDQGEFYFAVNGMYLDGIIPGVNEISNPVIFLLKTKN